VKVRKNWMPKKTRCVRSFSGLEGDELIGEDWHARQSVDEMVGAIGRMIG
jgi:hypothetical protein